MKKNLMLCALLLAVLLSGCAAEPLQGQTAGNTHRKLQRHRKERLLPLSRYPQNQTLPQKPRQKPPIQQLAHQMRTNTKAALLFLLSR